MKRKVLGALLLAFGLSVGVAQAASFFSASYSGPPPMNAEAKLTLSGDTLTIELWNTAGAGQLKEIGSVLSGIALDLSGSLVLATGTAEAYAVVTDVVTTHAGPVDLINPTILGVHQKPWSLENTGGTSWLLAAGEGTWKPLGIVNQYVEAKDGIPNDQHNPYAMGKATFTITGVTGVLGEDAVTKFYFNTDGTNVPPQVPIPGAALLLGSGLAAFGIFRRRS